MGTYVKLLTVHSQKHNFADSNADAVTGMTQIVAMIRFAGFDDTKRAIGQFDHVITVTLQYNGLVIPRSSIYRIIKIIILFVVLHFKNV